MERRRIGELLVEEGYLTVEQLEEALRVQEKKRDRIGSILIDLGYLTEATFLEFLANTPGIASVELPRCEIDRAVLDLVPKDVARRLEVVPIGKLRNLLTVAMVCPLDEASQKELESLTGLKVKPVLCSKTAVQGALERYYNGSEEVVSIFGPESDVSGLEQSLKLRRVAKLVEEIEDLPTLPDIAKMLSAVVHDPNSSASDVARIISSDSALSAKILKLANSAAYGFSRNISSIQQAVALLGLREIYAFALSVFVIDQFIDAAQFDLKVYWNHSFRCASLSKLISGGMGTQRTESAFVAGLLHDMGKVVLAMSMSGKQERATSLAPTGETTRVELEERVLGTTHAEVGHLLAEHWFLPPELTSAIRFHHLPELEPESKGLAPIVFLANTFCKAEPLSAMGEIKFDNRVLDLLKNLDLSETLLRSTLEAFAKISGQITVL